MTARLRWIAVAISLSMFCGKGRGGDLCTHSRPCAQGFVCVFGDDNVEVDRYEDETGECQTKAEVEILKRSLP